jgi:hypothetical protein
MAKKVNFPMWIQQGDEQFIQYPCHLSRNNLFVNDKNDEALVKSLLENSESLNLAFQLCGEAESCSIKITAEDILQGNILLFDRQNCLVSQKNWWDTLCGYRSYDENNGYLLLLQLSKEVSGDPLQPQEILQDFFRLLS